ncbi:MAG: NHLP bacteriocin system secretion protein [Magnetococcales bacterium]|nr:NHLP bacteriocin system secretion protein [Magnetococcales bacterium]
MQAHKQLFRQAALDRLASPDQLDRLVSVTDARGWVVALTVAGLLGFLGVWSVYGAIPTTVKSQGIILSRFGHVADAMAQAPGVLVEFSVSLYADVKKGQTVAVIDQAEVSEHLRDARDVVREKQAIIKRREAEFRRERNLKSGLYTKRTAALKQSIAEITRHIAYLSKLVSAQEKQVKKGIVARKAHESTRVDLSDARQNLADKRYEILTIQAEQLDLELHHEQERSRLEQDLNDAQRQVERHRKALARDGAIVAPIDGRVIEYKVGPGAMVQAGEAVVSIERTGGELQALLYAPTADGKKLHPGQSVRIEPATIKKEEFGSLLGTVREVSEFPVTPRGMTSVLQNPALVGVFSSEGPPYAVHVDLIADERAVSGYRWSSRQGPPIRLASGTTLNAEITVEEQSPASLFIPFLRKTVGIYQ